MCVSRKREIRNKMHGNQHAFRTVLVGPSFMKEENVTCELVHAELKKRSKNETIRDALMCL